MVSKRFSFLKNSKEDESNSYPKMEKKVIEFVVNEFPENADNIKIALVNLRDALEGSIDSIEDKSSEIIKHNRNFELSERYRQNSIKLYEISRSVEEYVKWMCKGSNNEMVLAEPKSVVKELPELIPSQIESIKIDQEKKGKIENENGEQKLESNYKTKQNKQLNNKEINKDNIPSKKAINIIEDFTGKQPIGFKLAEYEVEVEDWDDIIVKTAEVLTKYYKSPKVIENMKSKRESVKSSGKKKSPQNECRDTIIEMLNDYGVNPNQYKIYV